MVMDNTDCWITEFDYKSLTPSSSLAGFTSPGPSSGYCSSEEGQTYVVQGHGQVKQVGALEQKAPTVPRASESTWRSSDAFYGAHALDPYLGEVGGMLGSIEESAIDLKSSTLNFDYLMDTWNPLGETPMMSDYGDLLADFDMIDVNQSSALLSMPQVNNPGVAVTNGNKVQSKGWQKRAASPVDEAPGLAKKPSNPTLASSGAISVSDESRNRLKKVFDFQQQVAGLADMVVGDEEEYILQFTPAPKSTGVVHRINSTPPAAVGAARPSQAPNSGVPSTSGSPLIGGVFGVPSSLKNCETKALTRIRSGAVATSCGSLLRHSVSVPTSVKSAAAISKDSAASVRVGGSRSHTSVARGDMKGGRATTASLLALDDHRYTLKSVPNPPTQSKSGRSRKGNTASASSSTVPYSGKMSILEAFLRSTRPLDPNKGSNAALAAEGLAHLRIEADDEDDRRSGTILKKLLTGEIDQSEVHRCEERVIQERANCSIGQTIGEGFGLGTDLLLEDAEAASVLLCEDIGGGAGGLWMNAENEDESLSSELDEILREQTRQDDLWLRHYINCL